MGRPRKWQNNTQSTKTSTEKRTVQSMKRMKRGKKASSQRNPKKKQQLEIDIQGVNDRTLNEFGVCVGFSG